MSALPSVAEEVVVADFESELVVLVPSRRRAHLLEPIWALLFDSCRSGHTVDGLRAEIVAATDWNDETTRTWLDGAVAELQRSGVVVP